MIKIEIIGRIGKDAEVKEIKGKQHVSFNVASNRSWVMADGTKKETTTWVSVLYGYSPNSSLWKQLKAGTNIRVVGDLRVNAYEGKEGWQAGVTCNTHTTNIEILQYPRRTNDPQVQSAIDTAFGGPAR